MNELMKNVVEEVFKKLEEITSGLSETDIAYELAGDIEEKYSSPYELEVFIGLFEKYCYIKLIDEDRLNDGRRADFIDALLSARIVREWHQKNGIKRKSRSKNDR